MLKGTNFVLSNLVFQITLNLKIVSLPYIGYQITKQYTCPKASSFASITQNHIKKKKYRISEHRLSERRHNNVYRLTNTL